MASPPPLSRLPPPRFPPQSSQDPRLRVDAPTGVGLDDAAALSFNGTNQSIDVPNRNNLETPTTAVTVCSWVKSGDPGQSGNSEACVAGKLIDASSNPAYALVWSPAGSANFIGRLSVGGSTQDTPVTGTYQDIWVFLIMRWTSGQKIELRVYNQGGILKETVYSAATVTGSIDYVAGDPTGMFVVARNAFGNFFGSVGRVRAWARKLAESEVLPLIFNTVPATDAIIDLPLMKEGAWTPDVSGSTNHGAQINKPTGTTGPTGMGGVAASSIFADERSWMSAGKPKRWHDLAAQTTPSAAVTAVPPIVIADLPPPLRFRRSGLDDGSNPTITSALRALADHPPPPWMPPKRMRPEVQNAETTTTLRAFVQSDTPAARPPRRDLSDGQVTASAQQATSSILDSALPAPPPRRRDQPQPMQAEVPTTLRAFVQVDPPPWIAPHRMRPDVEHADTSTTLRAFVSSEPPPWAPPKRVRPEVEHADVTTTLRDFVDVPGTVIPKPPGRPRADDGANPAITSTLRAFVEVPPSAPPAARGRALVPDAQATAVAVTAFAVVTEPGPLPVRPPRRLDVPPQQQAEITTTLRSLIEQPALVLPKPRGRPVGEDGSNPTVTTTLRLLVDAPAAPDPRPRRRVLPDVQQAEITTTLRVLVDPGALPVHPRRWRLIVTGELALRASPALLDPPAPWAPRRRQLPDVAEAEVPTTLRALVDAHPQALPRPPRRDSARDLQATGAIVLPWLPDQPSPAIPRRMRAEPRHGVVSVAATTIFLPVAPERARIIRPAPAAIEIVPALPTPVFGVLSEQAARDPRGSWRVLAFAGDLLPALVVVEVVPVHVVEDVCGSGAGSRGLGSADDRGLRSAVARALETGDDRCLRSPDARQIETGRARGLESPSDRGLETGAGRGLGSPRGRGLRRK